MATKNVWLITGASTGLGYELALRALSSGDNVVATSRAVKRLEPLKASGAVTIRLDHNEPFESVKASVDEAAKAFGSFNVVVNNAAYVQTGTLEETSHDETLEQFQANVFGPLNVYRAVLPYLRQQRSGTLATIGSMAAWQVFPGFNLYNASKATMRVIAKGLEGETAGFGIKHCLIEPGYFRTELLNPTGHIKETTNSRAQEDYVEMNKDVAKVIAMVHGNQLGDPVKGAEIIYDVLTSSGVAKGREIPSELALGSDSVDAIKKNVERTIKFIDDWATISPQSDYAQGQ